MVELLDQPGWQDYPLKHSTGVTVDYDGNVMLPNSVKANLNTYWRSKVRQARRRHEARKADSRRQEAESQLGENIIQFAEKVRAIRP